MEVIIVVGLVAIIWCASFVVSGYIEGGDPFCFLKKRVYLLDYWGKIRFTREYVPGISYVYPRTRIGEVLLHSDGTTSGTGYIVRWSYNLKELISWPH